MRRKIPVLSRSLGLLALHLLSLTALLAQAVPESTSVKHYGYSSTDKFLECMHRVYGKPVARFPYIRHLPDLPCPNTREGIDDLLQSDRFSQVLNVPKGGRRGVRLFEMDNWLYVIPALFTDTQPGDPYYNFRKSCKSMRIGTKVETPEDISEAEDKMLREVRSRTPEIFGTVRMVPLGGMAEPGPDGTCEITIRMRLSLAKLSPDAAESVTVVIDEWPYVEIGRLAYGEIRDGKYEILWDSPLLNARGDIFFEDVNGDGRKEIVWRSATCGAQSCRPQQIVVFDKDGREITRQPDCRTGGLGFDETDGVCAIEGEDMRLAVISGPRPGSFEEEQRAPKDIVVVNRYGDGRDAIFTLENGMYVLNKLDAAQYSARLAAQRKAEGTKMAAALNEEGMQLMKEGKFQEAAYKFQSAYYANDVAVYENNYGFALYKLGQYESSAWWFKHVIKVDPKRAVAYLNLGDADAKINRNAEARDAYNKYLELAPDSKAAPDVKKKLDALPPTP